MTGLAEVVLFCRCVENRSSQALRIILGLLFLGSLSLFGPLGASFVPRGSLLKVLGDDVGHSGVCVGAKLVPKDPGQIQDLPILLFFAKEILPQDLPPQVLLDPKLTQPQADRIKICPPGERPREACSWRFLFLCACGFLIVLVKKNHTGKEPHRKTNGRKRPHARPRFVFLCVCFRHR